MTETFAATIAALKSPTRRHSRWPFLCVTVCLMVVVYLTWSHSRRTIFLQQIERQGADVSWPSVSDGTFFSQRLLHWLNELRIGGDSLQTTITLKGSTFDDDWLRSHRTQMRRIDRLKLELLHSPITDAGLTSLVPFTNLVVLDIHESAITSFGLQVLGSCRRLEGLSVPARLLTPESMIHVAACSA